jgi:ribosomal protein L20
MSRVKRGVTSHAKHKKVLKAAKGFFGRRKNTIRAANTPIATARTASASFARCGFNGSTRRRASMG